ncbi:MFS transporter [Pusillimonas sp. SM2304]|uniref:MFS transporter n=1 Tax=Pusillimonas sp. SM2304 TaxID=3073241 RepID=UPI002876220B|nr:MFS transporter [Pusillimonas sp. SM2304]MDS1140583.1 MFS transporter [Pusillimonas sp. SM2304]
MTRKPIGNWYFGWNIVAAAAILTMLTVGLRMGIGPFFLPIAHDLGFSRSVLAGIVAIGMLFYGIAMPLAGHLVAARGTRYVLLLGTALVLGSAAWAVMATGPISFLLSFGVLLSVGLAFVSPVTLTPVLSRWFTRRRGMALFFLSTGSMAGIAILTPVLSFMIETLDWRMTLLGFALFLTVVTVPIALLVIRDDAPPETDLLPDDQAKPSLRAARRLPGVEAYANLKVNDAVRSVPFWKVAFGLFACGYSMNLLGAHGVPMLMDHGFDAMTGAFGIGLIGFSAIFSTLVLGRLSDIIPRKNILAAIYLIRGLGFFALVMVGTHWELYLAATIGGIVWAGSVALSSAILADIYGVRLVGILYGWTYLGHQIGGTISSWLGGWGYETFGTHWVSFGSAGVLLLIASAVSVKLPLQGFTLLSAAPASGR